LSKDSMKTERKCLYSCFETLKTKKKQWLFDVRNSKEMHKVMRNPILYKCVTL